MGVKRKPLVANPDRFRARYLMGLLVFAWLLVVLSGQPWRPSFWDPARADAMRDMAILVLGPAMLGVLVLMEGKRRTSPGTQGRGGASLGMALAWILMGIGWAMAMAMVAPWDNGFGGEWGRAHMVLLAAPALVLFLLVAGWRKRWQRRESPR